MVFLLVCFFWFLVMLALVGIFNLVMGVIQFIEDRKNKKIEKQSLYQANFIRQMKKMNLI